VATPVDRARPTRNTPVGTVNPETSVVLTVIRVLRTNLRAPRRDPAPAPGPACTHLQPSARADDPRRARIGRASRIVHGERG